MNKTFNIPQYGKCHIISISKDMDEEIVTFKYWLRRRQSWVYKAETKWILNECYHCKI